MSLRVVAGWIVAGLGVLIILAVFGLNVFGVSAPFPPLGQILIGVVFLLLGYYIATGQPAIKS